MDNSQVDPNLCDFFLAEVPCGARNDPIYAGIAVGRNKHFYHLVSNKLKRDPLLMATAVKRGAHLRYFSEYGVHDDRAIVLVVMHVDGLELKDVSEALRGDREVVLAAVQQNGMALKYASAKLQRDKGIVCAAVRQNGMALKYASEELSIDAEVLNALIPFQSTLQ